jgi:hypothetical protein
MCGMRALGPAMVLVAAVVLCSFELGLGCSHDPKPAVVEPAGPPPLPPASGTPVGYLVDDASELKLTDDQLTRLKTIDEELAAKLGTLDAQLHSPSAAAGSGQPRGRRRGGGGGGGGFRGGGGRRGGMRGGGAGSGAGSGSAAPRSGAASADTVNRITEDRAADVRDAIDRALAVMDVVQRVIAKRVLTDHGVDLDAGRPAAASKAGSGEPSGEPDDTEPDEPGEPGGAGSGSS